MKSLAGMLPSSGGSSSSAALAASDSGLGSDTSTALALPTTENQVSNILINLSFVMSKLKLKADVSGLK